ncbi:3-oxoadipate enol-lactonase [Sphaerisporangium krabiense]|uniref:Pimeloyl-ACP methyl ester carboxylesterase n=1 Tax=Sphaerisporangium krabiense TaxID=763782 RepID=A0A7W9DMP2_9ACTN|nr:alpha/beta fold hydrolase [Sphaerisporangium krabiense]MBB5624591.1 pimeloyl-ACP methyl ester carboxylesterase [Sphaerisporangium krabiense]GII61456.1 3-oxoadipate enol-lactonase [Sphaerisporangium krabiense]
MGDLRFALVNGVRLAYRTEGDPAAPPLVLLPGRGYDHTDWDGVIGPLAESFRVHALSLRGHGRSDRPGRYALTSMRDDVVGLLDVLGLERASLAGHSLGGFVAYLVAQEYPDRVERLVLEDVPLPVPAGVAVPPRPEEPPDFDWAMVEQTTRQRNDPDPAWLEGLAKITAPTLVLAGGPSSHLPQEQVAELAARVPGAELVTIDAGHEIHGTRPAEFLTAVTAFLRR